MVLPPFQRTSSAREGCLVHRESGRIIWTRLQRSSGYYSVTLSRVIGSRRARKILSSGFVVCVSFATFLARFLGGERQLTRGKLPDLARDVITLPGHCASRRCIVAG